MGNALEFLPIPPSPPSQTTAFTFFYFSEGGGGKKPVLSLKARKYRMQRSKRRQNACLLLNLGKMEHKKSLLKGKERI